MDKLLITNIQRFSLHDGPGIRTTVFFKGCTLNCPWCCNPENISFKKESYNEENQTKYWGKEYSSSELLKELLKDQIYYGSYNNALFSTYINSETFEASPKKFFNSLPGGITLSGGEPLMHIMKLCKTLELLKNNKIHITAESCLFVPNQFFEKSLEYIDLFYVDFKYIARDKIETILQGSKEQFFNNLQLLDESNKPYIVRVPVIGGFTDSYENADDIIDEILTHKSLKVEIIKGHNLAKEKYVKLNKQFSYSTPNNDVIDYYYHKLSAQGLWVEKLSI